MKITKLLLSVGFIFAFTQVFSQTATEMPEGKAFLIQSAMNFGINNGGYWDIPGDPTDIQMGSNIQVWDLNQGVDRNYTLIRRSYSGVYEIAVGDTPNARVDIAGGGSGNGTNVWVWERNNTTAQKFRFEHLGNGRFKIYEAYDRIICLDGRNNANGTNVHIWDNHDGPWVEWYLIDVATKKPFIPNVEPIKVQAENNSTLSKIPYVPEATKKFKMYQINDTLSTKRLFFKQGYLDIYSSEPYTFNNITIQKPKLDSDTYDASGAIMIQETSQEVFWSVRYNNNTGTSTKILFYVQTNEFPKIQFDTNLDEMPMHLKNQVRLMLNSSINMNHPQLKISEISQPQITYTKINGNYIACGVSTAKSDVDLVISSYIIFIKHDEVFKLKVTMANDDRRMVLEDLIEKLLSSIVFN